MSRCVAVDVEFIKCCGAQFARAVAFVPFSAQPLSQPPSSSSSSSSSLLHTTTRQTCCLHAPPTVLFLRSSAVMSQADVLPCGHVLRDRLAHALVHGEELTRIKARHTRDAAAALDLHRELLREARALQQQHKQKQQLSSSAAAHGSNSSSGGGGLSPAEAALRRELQIRAGIAAHYDVLDAHSVPNIRRSPIMATALQRLYDATVDSAAFAHAVAQLSPLRSYGKGRGAQKSLAFLARYHPQLLHDVLHASFASASQWCAWLHECADGAEAELRRVAAVHTSGQYPLLQTTATTAPPCLRDTTTAAAAAAAAHVHTCATLDELSRQLSRCWRRCLRASGGCKMFVYGSVDRSVIHATLRLSCNAATATTTAATTTAAGTERGKHDNDNNNDKDDDDGVLRSPYEAQVVDLTSHSLFAAAGFVGTPRRVPALAAALAKVATTTTTTTATTTSAAQCEDTAQRVHALARLHDPLWDAQALACVCVACGVARGDN